MFLIKLLFKTKKIARLGIIFDPNIFMNIRKTLKCLRYNVRYVFKIQTTFKSKKHNKSEYFDQIILMRRRNLKLITFQANFWIIYVTILTQDKAIKRIEEILVNLYL